MLSLDNHEKERLVRDDIQRNGWSIIYVIDEEEVDPPFAYSVGLFEKLGHPEIIIVGTTEALASPVIDNMGYRIGEEGVRYENGRYYDGIIERFECYMHCVPKDCYPDYVGWDLWYYQSDAFPLLQCVYPCDGGLFPWDPAAQPLQRRYQPIIGGFQRH